MRAPPPGTIIVLFALGCAAGAKRGALELTPWQPPQGQICEVNGGDFPLGAILDSVATVRALESLDPPDGALLLSVSTDSTGALDRFRPIETTFTEGAARAVQDRMAPHVGRRDGVRRHGRLLVETADAGVARLAVGPARTCRPAVTNQNEIRRALQAVYQEQQRVGEATVWLFVDTAGAVARSHVNVGSGYVPLDAAILRAARLARFRPALIDRAPAPVWVAITLGVAKRCPPAADTMAWRLPPNDPCLRLGATRRRR